METLAQTSSTPLQNLLQMSGGWGFSGYGPYSPSPPHSYSSAEEERRFSDVHHQYPSSLEEQNQTGHRSPFSEENVQKTDINPVISIKSKPQLNQSLDAMYQRPASTEQNVPTYLQYNPALYSQASPHQLLSARDETFGNYKVPSPQDDFRQIAHAKASPHYQTPSPNPQNTQSSYPPSYGLSCPSQGSRPQSNSPLLKRVSPALDSSHCQSLSPPYYPPVQPQPKVFSQSNARFNMPSAEYGCYGQAILSQNLELARVNQTDTYRHPGSHGLPRTGLAHSDLPTKGAWSNSTVDAQPPGNHANFRHYEPPRKVQDQDQHHELLDKNANTSGYIKCSDDKSKEGNDEKDTIQDVGRVVYPWMIKSAGRSEKKQHRKQYTRMQTMMLEQEFLSFTYLSRRRRQEVAESLDLTDRQVKIWFQNRRTKWKKSMYGKPINTQARVETV